MLSKCAQIDEMFEHAFFMILCLIIIPHYFQVRNSTIQLIVNKRWRCERLFSKWFKSKALLAPSWRFILNEVDQDIQM